MKATQLGKILRAMGGPVSTSDPMFNAVMCRDGLLHRTLNGFSAFWRVDLPDFCSDIYTMQTAIKAAGKGEARVTDGMLFIGSCKVPTLDPNGFPHKLAVPIDTRRPVRRSDMLSALNAVLDTHTDQLAGSLDDIAFETDTIIGTDSVRLTVAECPMELAAQVRINVRAARILARLLALDLANNCYLEAAEGDRYFTVQGADFVFRADTSAVQYPNWRAIMPQKHSGTLNVNVPDFIAALKSAIPISKMNKNRLAIDVFPSLERGIVRASSQELDMKVETAFAVEWSGCKPFRVGMNARYLLDGLEAAGKACVTWKIPSGRVDGLPHLLEWRGVQYLIMPINGDSKVPEKPVDMDGMAHDPESGEMTGVAFPSPVVETEPAPVVAPVETAPAPVAPAVVAPVVEPAPAPVVQVAAPVAAPVHVRQCDRPTNAYTGHVYKSRVARELLKGGQWVAAGQARMMGRRIRTGAVPVTVPLERGGSYQVYRFEDCE